MSKSNMPMISAQVEESGRCVMRVSEAELDGEGAPGNMLIYVQRWQGSLPRRGDRVARHWRAT